MLLRHTAYYVVARGLPGLLNFAALVVYTRLLQPEDFGRYALVLAGVGLANVIVFHWLLMVLSRFLPAHKDDPRRFLAGLLSLFLVLALAITGAGSLLAFAWPDPVWQRLLALAVPLLLAQAWFELNLELLRARLEPSRYGRLLTGKAMISLTLGAWLAWIGLGAMAPLLGLLVGHLTAFLLFALATWRGIAPRWPEGAVLREQLRYGLPLTVTFALGWVVTSSDRLLIAWLLDEAAVGVYAAGYDLAYQSITLLLAIINTAAYPLAVNAMESGGDEAAGVQLWDNGALIGTVALGSATALAVLAPQIVAIVIGEGFREGALHIVPWVALAAAVAGIKAYHLDIAFHLGCESRWLAVTGAMAAIANLALNLVLIPRFGIVGAAWATLAAFGLAAVASGWLGRKVWAMPPLMPLVLRGALAALAVGMAAWWGARLGASNGMSLTFGLASGLAAGFGAGFVFNIAGLRDAALHRWQRWTTSPLGSAR